MNDPHLPEKTDDVMAIKPSAPSSPLPTPKGRGPSDLFERAILVDEDPRAYEAALDGQPCK